jgi:Zn-dependent peptidase ImmA (M78 family)
LVEAEFIGDQRRKVFFHELGHLMFDDQEDEDLTATEGLEVAASAVATEDVLRVVCRHTTDEMDVAQWEAREVDAENFALVTLSWNAELRACNRAAQQGVVERPQRSEGVGPDGSRNPVEVVFDEPRGVQ